MFKNGRIVIGFFESDSVVTRRPLKGKSLWDLPERYVVVDIETTGLDPTFDEIIEVSGVRYDSGVEVSQFSSLVKPQNEIDSYITSLTGITNEMVSEAPEAVDVLPRFLDFLGDDVLVAHNANFDINFVYSQSEALVERFLTNNFVDTLRIARRLFPDFKTHKLDRLCEVFGLLNRPTHRSLSDCFATQELYQYLVDHINSNDIDFNALKPKKRKLSASEVHASISEFDESHPLCGKKCVFTGTLARMSRKEAMQLVADAGGVNGDGITVDTNFLILGNFDYCNTLKDGKSSKLKKAEKYILEGKDLQILSEDVFYDLVLSE